MARDLKLGVQLGYWQAQPPPDFVEVAQEAERLGYDKVFTAEAWGSDAFTPLTWIAAHTSKIKLGTAVVQLSARTPAATAMHVLTLDHLSKGRVILGLGVSGPQVVEGWYGQPFAKPLARTREYVDVIRQVLAREKPVKNDGPHYPLPYYGEGSWKLGKPLKPITHPLRADVPIYLGAEGPKNVALAAEICDGWLPLYYSPYRPEVYEDSLAQRKPGFDVCAGVMVNVHDDVSAALMPMKFTLGFYIGGMGAKKRNFHMELMSRMGFEAEAEKIQELFLEGKREEAVRMVPDEFADEISLVGPVERIRERLEAWKETPVTTLLLLGPTRDTLRTMAELVLKRGRSLRFSLPPFKAEVRISRNVPSHLPLKTGLRFSRKARGPSRASSDEKTGMPMGSSFWSKASRSGRPAVSRTARRMARTASGPLAAMRSAMPRAASSAVPSGTTRPIRPISRQRAAE